MAVASHVVVAELGVGNRPPARRPFAPFATYVGVDVDSSLFGERAGSVVADGCRLPFANSSVDHVVLRNVLGDVGLGHDFEEATGTPDPAAYAATVRALVADGARERLEALRGRVLAMAAAAASTKIGILGESRRVLRSGGSLLVIETMTPGPGRQFVERLCGGPARDEVQLTAGSATFQCVEVRSHNRRRRCCVPDELAEPELAVWLLR